MSDKVVAGADLTGNKENPNEAWLVVGRISNLGLEILDVKKTGSHLLAKDLAAHKTLDYLGVNCPLSLPTPFLEYLAQKKLKKNYETWQEIVEELVFTPWEEFLGLAKEFSKEPKRVTDTAAGAAGMSPMRRANPPLLHMTHHGIRVMASLYPKRFFVLPFQDPIPFGCAVMEVQPRDTAKFLQLQDINYGAKDSGKDKSGLSPEEAQREKIVHNLMKIKERKALTYKDFPTLIVQKNFMHNFLHNDKAVDALITCYTSAVYASAPAHFDDPFSADALEVLLEGWTYRLKN